MLKKKDLLLIAVIAILSLLILTAVRNKPRNEGSFTTLVCEDGEHQIDLSKDGIYDFSSNGINIHIRVADGKAAFVNSECPDHLCEKVGICIPAKASFKGASADAAGVESDLSVKEDGTYTSKEEVALYIHTYHKLPSNFITKTKAKKAGWKSEEGNLQDVCPGMSIGGGAFHNDEGILPDGEYKECDINYSGGRRGSERIVYTDDGSVYYTSDHYQTFEKLY